MQLKHYLSMWQRQLKSGSDDLALNRYTEFVQYHYENALKKMYRRFTVEFNVDWEEVAKDYYSQYPAESYELNRLTYSFPEFVESNFKKYNWPEWAFDLSQYELSEFTVFTDDQVVVKDLFLKLNPTLLVLKFEYNIAQWVVAKDLGQSIAMMKSPHLLAISRNAETHLCQFSLLSAEMIDIIEQMQSGSGLHNQVMNSTIEWMMKQSILV